MMNIKLTTKIRASQLTSQVIEHLRNAISTGDLAIGSKLPAEPLLMKEFGIGRSTLREAIRVLSHNGILEVRQGDGTYVRALPSHGEPLAQKLRRAGAREVNEVRKTLELEIVRLAAQRRNEEDLRRISAALKLRNDALSSNDTAALLDADIAFHCAVAEAAGNKLLADLYRTFALTLREALAALWDAADGKALENSDLHAALLAAVEDRDASRAVEACAAMIESHGATLSLMENT